MLPPLIRLFLQRIAYTRWVYVPSKNTCHSSPMLELKTIEVYNCYYDIEKPSRHQAYLAWMIVDIVAALVYTDYEKGYKDIFYEYINTFRKRMGSNTTRITEALRPQER